MFKLDNNFLNSLGLGSLPVDEKNRLLQAIYERLEMNVGMRLAEGMTDAQLDEFEGFIDRNDEAGALRWLETNFPNYKQVVAQELDKLKAEISQAAPQILAAAQQQPNSSVVQPGNPPANQQPYSQPLNQPIPQTGNYPSQSGPVQQDPVYPPSPAYNNPNQNVRPSFSQPSELDAQENKIETEDTSWPDKQPPPGPGLA